MSYLNQNLTIERVKFLIKNHIDCDDFGFMTIIKSSVLSKEELKFLRFWVSTQELFSERPIEDLEVKAFNDWKVAIREEKLNSILNQ
jgi:hypothetical protein